MKRIFFSYFCSSIFLSNGRSSADAAARCPDSSNGVPEGNTFRKEGLPLPKRPLETHAHELAEDAVCHLALRPGTNVALLNALAQYFIELFAKEFKRSVRSLSRAAEGALASTPA